MKKFRTATIIILTTAVLILTAAVLLLISLEVIDAAVPPTCTETGLTEGRHSFLGGKVTKKQQPVEATGHDISDGFCQTCGLITYELGYRLNDDGKSYRVSGIGTCKDKDLVIPAEYHGLPVTAIGESAFEGCKRLKSVRIPDSITSIGNSAFGGCSGLMEINIPDSVTDIGESAFGYCSKLTGVTIPGSVVKINARTFVACQNLTSVSIPWSVAYIGDHAFSQTGLKEIRIPGGVEYLGKYVFFHCEALESVIMEGGGVFALNGKEFSYSENLKNIVFGSNLTSIDFNIYGSLRNLESISVSESNRIYKSVGNCLIEKETQTLILGCKNSVIPDNGDVKIIGSSAFKQCMGLTDIVIPDGVTTIDYWAFFGCTGVKSATIGKDVTDIYGISAYSLPNIESVTISPQNKKYRSAGNCVIETETGTVISGFKTSIIPDDGSITCIGENAFAYCAGLKYISIPDGVISIGADAFRDCKALAEISIPASVTELGSGAFSSCPGLAKISVSKANGKYYSAGNCIIETATGTLVVGCSTSVIPGDKNITRIGAGAFTGCTGLKNIVIPDTITDIENDAFCGCSELEGVVLGSGLKHIGKQAFYNCLKMKSIVIPDGVVSIGADAFFKCKALTEISIPASVTELGSGVFSNCTELKSVVIHGNILSLEDITFYLCSKLAELRLPGSIKKIGYRAFSNNSILEVIYFDGTKSQWESIEKTEGWYRASNSDAVIRCTDGDIVGWCK